MKITRPTVMEVNLNDFEYNVNQIKKMIGNNVDIMPVIKANAYGTYINLCNDILNKFNIVAVAIVDEAVALRKQGYNKEIFVLNQPSIDEIENIIEYEITVGICDKYFIEELSKYNKKVKVHLEIDTGMGRTGINPQNVIDIINKIKLNNNIIIEGIYTHFSSPDTDYDYTKNQIKVFNECVEKAKEIVNFKYIHSSASNGILNFSECYYNLVRPGMILYGYESGENILEKIDLKPVCKLKSKITFLKEVDEGTSIGYSRRFITNKKSKIATIPIGYADGLTRVSNKGFVVIKNQRAPIIGSVCMDSIMVDVTNIKNVSINEDVYIWDNKLIKLEEIASLTSTINYEIISRISERVPRIFVKG